MKRFLLIMVLCGIFSAFATIAQEPIYKTGMYFKHHPVFFELLDDGTRKLVTYKEFNYHSYVLGDTVVAGEKCKKIRHEYHGPEKYPWDAVENYRTVNDISCCLEKDGVVYVWNEEPGMASGNEHWDIKMELTLNVGDTTNTYYKWVVQNEFTMELCGVERKVQHLTFKDKYTDEIDNDYLVEGIGLVNNRPVTRFTRPMSSTFWGFFSEEVYDADGKKIFDREEFEEKLKEKLANPTGIEKVTDDSESPENMQLYDLYGRPVSKPINGRIYITNGRKILWRKN